MPAGQDLEERNDLYGIGNRDSYIICSARKGYCVPLNASILSLCCLGLSGVSRCEWN
jgi:hypothetical protein